MKLIDFFKSPKDAWEALPEALGRITGFKSEITNKILRERERINIEEEWDKLEGLNINLIAYYDEQYPPRLKHIYDPPPLLYIRGNFEPKDSLALAIVGSRRYTLYGKEIAIKLAGKIASLGFTVISGLARGIDTFAHRGAIDSGGRTIAVLGTGIDVCYPRENNKLLEEISTKGAVITEFPPGTKPFRFNFPLRNRIISGISLGVLVVEAPEKSGALITANLAVEQGREVFAIPGSIGSPYSRGCHKLIKSGAKLVEEIDDILEEFKAFLPDINITTEEINTKEVNNLSKEQSKILDTIPYDPIHIDKIIQLSKLSPANVSAILIELELQGLIKQLPGGNYMKL